MPGGESTIITEREREHKEKRKGQAGERTLGITGIEVVTMGSSEFARWRVNNNNRKRERAQREKDLGISVESANI